MKFEEHCKRTMEVLGDEYPHVHLWLDALAWDKDKGFNPFHRKFRHHQQGVAQVRDRWGEGAAKAAERHILDDLYGPGVNDPRLIPVDQAQYAVSNF